MNQILVSEKLYVTPEIKKKRKLFKFTFFLSVFLLCVLSSYGIYAEYDRNKSEEVSKYILGNMPYQNKKDEAKAMKEDDDSIVILLNKINKEALNSNISKEIVQELVIPEENKFIASDGTEYYSIGKISIPEIELDYPILSSTTEELLKKSPCKFWGPNPNQQGNFCIVGHNYRNNKFFSKVPTLEEGSYIFITDLFNNTHTYEVYLKYSVNPDDLSCTNQDTNGKKEITLITCTNDNKERVIVKAREVS